MKAVFPGLSRAHWMIPLGVLVLSSAAIGVFGLDLLVSGWFYRGFQDQSWPVGESPFWRWFYVWGEIPAVAVFSGGVFSAAWGLTRLGAKAAARGWAWRGGLLVAVALAVGPLLVINWGLKSHYGRPRPRQVVEFGGDRVFQPLFSPTLHTDERGFPSGHAGAGYALMVPYFALRPRKPRLARWVLTGGAAYGLLMSAARVAQGAHFLSDVVWSFGVVWFCAYLLARWMEPRWEKPAPQVSSFWGRAGVWGVAVVLGGGVLGLALARHFTKGF